MVLNFAFGKMVGVTVPFPSISPSFYGHIGLVFDKPGQNPTSGLCCVETG